MKLRNGELQQRRLGLEALAGELAAEKYTHKTMLWRLWSSEKLQQFDRLLFGERVGTNPELRGLVFALRERLEAAEGLLARQWSSGCL